MGFDKYPPNFTIRICPLEGVSDTVVNEYKKLMWNVAQARKTAVNLKSIEKKRHCHQINRNGRT